MWGHIKCHGGIFSGQGSNQPCTRTLVSSWHRSTEPTPSNTRLPPRLVFPKAATPTSLPKPQGPSLHQCVGAFKLSHHSSDKLLHLLKVTLDNAARTINQEDNVHLLTWALCREEGRNQRCLCGSQPSPRAQKPFLLHRVKGPFLV